MTRSKNNLVTIGDIESRILMMRGRKAMLDADLAELYGVSTKALVQAVKRNRDRFPLDFMFRLEIPEVECLRSQSVTSKGRGGRRSLPYAFTEQGVAMLSSVLRSERAVRVNIEIMRTFVRLRRMLESHEELARKIAEIEKRYDAQFKAVFDAIRRLMRHESNEKRRIGFNPPDSQPEMETGK